MEENSNKSNANIIDLDESSDNFIAEIMNTPLDTLEGMAHTLYYGYTAQCLGMECYKDNGVFDKRYRKNLSLLEEDIEAAPIVIKRLEAFLRIFPPGSINNTLAKEYLPYVRKFYKLLNEYNNPKEIKQ